MCVPIDRNDPRTRATRIAANLSLIAGLLLLKFARPPAVPHHAWFDALTGLFLGFYITVNLFTIARARRRDS